MMCAERSRNYQIQSAEGLHHNLPAFLAYSDNSFPLDIGITSARKELPPIGHQGLPTVAISFPTAMPLEKHHLSLLVNQRKLLLSNLY